MTRTSGRALRPGFDDLEGRHLLSTLSPVGRSLQGNPRSAQLIAAASVQPSFQPGIYFLRDRQTNLNLDSNAARAIYTNNYNGGRYQRWEFRPSGDGSTFFIRDVATNFYLDGRGSPHHMKVDDFSGSDYQRWRLFPSGDGYYVLQNKKTGLFLDSNADGAVYQLPYNGGRYQQWQLTATTP